MKKTVRLSTVLVSAFAFSLLASTQVYAAVYSNSSLKGAYSMLTNAWPTNQSDNPCSTLSIADFDGAENLTIVIYQDCVGTVNRYSGNGTYTVAKDGSGSMNVNLLLTSGVSTDAIVVNSAGKSFQFVQTSCTYCGNSDVAAGTGVAMGASSFSNASLKGNYEWMLTKWNRPNVALGVIAFDGVGNAKGSFTEVSGATPQTSTFTGTYSVYSQGDGSLTMTDQNGVPVTFVIVANSASSTGLDAKGVQLLVASTGASGRATKH